MAGGDDFYSRDRPENPQMPEDRPRGGGPAGGTAPVRVCVWWVVAAVIIVILWLVFFF
ncbi:hypothetical protein ACF09I_27825 [Streptomyces sp. NPDC014940]|uniref:hypothetical protein n=1 Tax=Streptomyces sp. NPDC014940 TaxID=3364932 RepID=UPI0036FBFF25